MRFFVVAFATPAPDPERMPPLLVISLVAALSLLFLAAVWLALRQRRGSRPRRAARPPAAAPAGPAHKPVALSRDETNELLQNARDMARADPERAARTMRRWLSDSES